MDRFRYVLHAQEVIFGAGALAQLGEAMERAGWNRLLLCTSRSMKSNGSVAQVQHLMGEKLAALFDQVHPHVQDVQVEEALALARRHDVDVVLGLGGGSPIGVAKAIGFQCSLPIAAVPSTYAGSEMTAVYGITHTRESPARKITVADPQIGPALVIYDPDLTLDLPPALTASTGINALAHCIEALYSITRHPLSTAAALDGIRRISRALLRCYQDGQDLQARTEMLLGAHLSGFSLASVTMGLHHGLCHVLGGTAKVPHGIANGIILPHAIRFNADAAAALLLPAAEALGISSNGNRPEDVIEGLGQAIFDLVGRMSLPQRLREVAVEESQLRDLAPLAFQNRTVHNNPKPIQEARQLEDLLRAAW